MKYNHIVEGIKYCVATFLKKTWNIFGLVLSKQKKRIVFDSYMGKQYSCNPRAIYEYMQKHFSDVEYIWAFKNPKQFDFLTQNSSTIVCKYRSLKHLYYCYVAQVIVFNYTLTNEMPVRKGQMIIQTWHGGGCYKKVGASIEYNSSIHNWILKKHANEITHYVSSSEYFSREVIRKQYKYNGTILSTGMPRNDVFFDEIAIKLINEQIRRKYSISLDDYVVLYAPTYRDWGENIEEPDYEMLKEILLQNTGKDIRVLYRGHHYVDKKVDSSIVLDVNNHYDMQDILCATDLLITDYSSSMWDFSFTGKPCLLFVPDLKQYQAQRGFDTDIHTWGFPVCETNEELFKAIEHFDSAEYIANMDNHHKTLGSYENGTATKQICQYICKQLDEA